MSGPLIYVNAYWEHLTQEQAFSNVLCLLLRSGYRLQGSAVVAETEDGVLPPVAYLPDLPSIGCALKTVHGVTAQALSDGSRLRPIEVPIVPTDRANLPCTLTYSIAPMSEPRHWSKHLISIIASGADMNLLDNVGAAAAGKTPAMRGRKQDRWQHKTLRLLGERLRPDFANVCMESSSSPPAILMKSRTLADFAASFVAAEVTESRELAARLGASGGWIIETSERGAYINVRQPVRDATAMAAGIDLICKQLQNWFKRAPQRI